MCTCSLEVYVEARDLDSTNQRVGHTRLLINVEDVNDNSPVINVDFIFFSKENTGDELTLISSFLLSFKLTTLLVALRTLKQFVMNFMPFSKNVSPISLMLGQS